MAPSIAITTARTISPSKLFARHYDTLGRNFLDQRARAQIGIEKQLAAIIDDAYALFDQNPELFAFLLLSQHDHLEAIGEVDTSPVDVVRDLLAEAMAKGEIDKRRSRGGDGTGPRARACSRRSSPSTSA